MVHRTSQSFRARLVDTVDRVLDLVAEDPGFHFQLDGQCIAVEDYLEIRPERRTELEAACDNTARDHRLRLLFPTGKALESFEAATTFDRSTRTPEAVDASRSIHPAPDTFPHQGWIRASELTVAAPGLPEAEVDRNGTIAITLLRSTGWLSRPDLRSRPGPAGPNLATPDAQCLETIRARLSLFAAAPEAVEVCARDAEFGLLAVAAGPEPLVPANDSLLRLIGEGLSLSALKPAETGSGLIARILNPGDPSRRARLRLAFDLAEAHATRLDGTPADWQLDIREREIEFEIPPMRCGRFD